MSDIGSLTSRITEAGKIGKHTLITVLTHELRHRLPRISRAAEAVEHHYPAAKVSFRFKDAVMHAVIAVLKKFTVIKRGLRFCKSRNGYCHYHDCRKQYRRGGF